MRTVVIHVSDSDHAALVAFEKERALWDDGTAPFVTVRKLVFTMGDLTTTDDAHINEHVAAKPVEEMRAELAEMMIDVYYDEAHATITAVVEDGILGFSQLTDDEVRSDYLDTLVLRASSRLGSTPRWDASSAGRRATAIWSGFRWLSTRRRWTSVTPTSSN